MNVTLVELAVAALATWQAVEVWHHSALMAPLRARAELLEGWAGDLLACPWCLSVWVAAVVSVVLLAGGPAVRGDLGDGVLWVLQLVGSWLAVAVVNVLVTRAIQGRVREGVKAGVMFWLIVGLLGLAAWGLWRPGWEWALYAVLVVLKVAVLTLAVSRLANLGNDLAHKWCRTPRGFWPIGTPKSTNSDVERLWRAASRDEELPGPVKNVFEKEADCAGRTEPDGTAPPGV